MNVSHTNLRFIGNAHLAVYNRHSLSNSVNIGANFISASNHMFAHQLTAPADLIFSGVDYYLEVSGSSGSTNGMLGIFEIQSDSDGVPSGTVIGSGSLVWNVPQNDDWIGYKAFQESASVSTNQPFWLVMRDGNGVPPSHSGSYSYANLSGTAGLHYGAWTRFFNGTDWTTTTKTARCGTFVLHHASGYMGTGTDGSITTNTVQIYGTTCLGLRFRMKGRPKIIGFQIALLKAGAPGSLEWKFYKGSEFIETVATFDAGDIFTTSKHRYIYLSSLYEIEPNVDYYIYGHQVSDAGSSANRYNLLKLSSRSGSGYSPLECVPDWYEVTGANGDPTGWTVISGSSVSIYPTVQDMTNDWGKPTISL